MTGPAAPRSRRRPWGAPAAWAVVILIGSSLPGSGLEPLPVSDKVPHFLEYLVLALLCARALVRPVPSGRRAQVLALAVLLAFAALDEGHQALVPGRSPDVLDWAADAAGILAGLGIGLAIGRWSASRTPRTPLDPPRATS